MASQLTDEPLRRRRPRLEARRRGERAGLAPRCAAFISCAMLAKNVPQSPASPSSIHRRIRSAIGESGGVSEATAASTRRSTQLGMVDRQPQADASATRLGLDRDRRQVRASRSAVATASAMTRGCMIRSASAGSSGSGRPMTVTGRPRARRSQRRCEHLLRAGQRAEARSRRHRARRAASPAPCPRADSASIRPPAIGIVSVGTRPCCQIRRHRWRATIGPWPRSAARTSSTSPTSRASTSTDEEVDRMQAQLSNILEAIETLRDVDTSHVGPTASVIQLENVMREDSRPTRALARRGARERAPPRRPVPARPDRPRGGPMSDALPLADRTITEVAAALRERRDELARADRCLPRAHRARRRAAEHVPRHRGRCGPTGG